MSRLKEGGHEGYPFFTGLSFPFFWGGGLNAYDVRKTLRLFDPLLTCHFQKSARLILLFFYPPPVRTPFVHAPFPFKCATLVLQHVEGGQFYELERFLLKYSYSLWSGKSCVEKLRSKAKARLRESQCEFSQAVFFARVYCENGETGTLNKQT